MNFHRRVAAAIAMTFLLSGCQEEVALETIIAKYGHLRLVPPTDSYGPGSLVAKRNYNPYALWSSNVELDDLCIRKFSIDKYGNAPTVSMTETRKVTALLDAKFNFGVDAVKKVFNIDLNSKVVDTVDVTVTDVKVLTYTVEDRQNIVDGLETKCRNIVNRYVKRKNAYQIASVIQASVDLEVTYNASASVDARAKLVKKLGDLGVSVDEATGRTVLKGKALVYGVAIDPLEEPI